MGHDCVHYGRSTCTSVLNHCVSQVLPLVLRMSACDVASLYRSILSNILIQTTGDVQYYIRY